jgi:opacity protein-like surface antigen
MKRIAIQIIALVLFGTSGYSQQWKLAPLEFHGGVAILHYFGDIGGSASESTMLGLKDINLAKVRPGLILGARYQFMKVLQVKGSYTLGVITQSDLRSRNENRNFAFSTLINELTVSAEYYIIPESDENYYYSIMRMRGGFRHFRQPLSLYVSLGAGGVHFATRALADFKDSPRFDNSHSFALVIPAGIGIKYAIMPSISVGAGLNLRYTSTDYLDGFTSLFSDFNDVYYSFDIKLNYKIQTTRKRNVGAPRRKFFF